MFLPFQAEEHHFVLPKIQRIPVRQISSTSLFIDCIMYFSLVSLMHSNSHRFIHIKILLMIVVKALK